MFLYVCYTITASFMKRKSIFRSWFDLIFMTIERWVFEIYQETPQNQIKNT